MKDQGSSLAFFLSLKREVPAQFGLRHPRCDLVCLEATDAIVLVVSEELGTFNGLKMENPA